MTTIDEIINKIAAYNPRADLDLVRRAYVFAEKAHEGQTRLTGDPYITHPLEAACVLADLEMDSTSIAAGLLHDVMEDSGVSMDQLKDEFGIEIARLVDGVTKLKLADFEVAPREEK